jgi:anaerobic selenocysteine-containing dehydrogenase
MPPTSVAGADCADGNWLPSWETSSGKANFLIYDGLGEDPIVNDQETLWLSTIRSHDQCNTTLYSMTDRYRGMYGQRDVVFLNRTEMEKRGLEDGDRVDLVTLSTDGVERRVCHFRVVGYSFPDGCCAAHYPETDPLVPLCAHDPLIFTPSSKGIPIRLEPSRVWTGDDCLIGE